MAGRNVAQPKPDFCKYQGLIMDIEKGNIQIPKFQRDFVWEKKKSADLMDSILKGYPIGTFVLWKTRERLNNIKRLGNQELPEIPDDNFIQYVLDGQQRLASLFVILNGLTVEKDGKLEDYKKIYIDLEVHHDSENVVSIDEPENIKITVYDLLNKGIADLAKEYSNEHLEKIQTYQNALRSYDFSTILINEYPMEKAVEVFNRINTTGKSLTLFEIMVAKTYDDHSFDLGDKYDSLRDDLTDVAYLIPPAQLLQCISINLTKECKRKVILDLPREDIVRVWDETVASIKKAVDHFRRAYKIPSSRLLPYPALIVPFSYFFFKNRVDPTTQQDTYLKEYFWRAALTSRFTSSVESKLALDCRFIDAIIAGDRPHYGKEFNISLTVNDIRDLQFHVGESINNAVLCVLAAATPKSFKNGNDIILDNSRLNMSNSRSYHHFFPKAFLKKQKIEVGRRNLIANITLVDDRLNKEMKDKPPSKYMREFQRINPNIASTMKSHLIDDLDHYGVWNDNYTDFIQERSDRIWEELKARFDPGHAGA